MSSGGPYNVLIDCTPRLHLGQSIITHVPHSEPWSNQFLTKIQLFLIYGNQLEIAENIV